MVRYIKIFLLLIFVLIWYSSASAQGMLFTREVANQKFGPVLKSIDLPVNTLLSFTNQTGNQIMFRIQDNQVVILDERRNVLYPAGMQVNSQDVFTVFSVSIINELLSNGSGVLVSIEQREDVLSISYGQLTMEDGALCPPFCSN